MSNTIAFLLGLLIVGALAIDVTMFDTEHVVFLSKKFFDLIEWMAFWR